MVYDESEFEKFEQRSREDGLENTIRRFYSWYRGVVTSITDPNARGRIKFRLDLISDVPEWGNFAEPLPVFAGTGFGIFFPPRVGDVVHIAFEFGDVNQPFYIGGFWANPAHSELPEEIFDRITPATTRLIKTPAGHALIFEDGDETLNPMPMEKRVELRTASMTIPADGSPPVVTIRHQLIMSDRDRRVELSSTGEDAQNPGVKFHILEFDDLLKKVTLKSGQGHSIVLDGTTGAEKITITTKGGHKFTLDDTIAAPKISLETVGKSSIVMDDTPGKQQINITTPQQRQVLLDDTGPGNILVKDPLGNIINAGPAGIQVTSPSMVNVQAGGLVSVTAAGAVSVQGAGIAQSSIGGPVANFATGAASALFLGLMNSVIVGAVSAVLLGGLTLIVPTLVTLTAASIAVLSGAIALGTGAQFALLNANLLVWLSTHTHTTSAPGVPTGPPIQSDQLTDPAQNTVYLTQEVTAS